MCAHSSAPKFEVVSHGHNRFHKRGKGSGSVDVAETIDGHWKAVSPFYLASW